MACNVRLKGGQIISNVIAAQVLYQRILSLIAYRIDMAALDEWATLTRFIGPTGTPTSTALSGTEAVGQTTLSVTNPTAANFNHVGKFIFIKNTTAASCEIAWLMACGADA